MRLVIVVAMLAGACASSKAAREAERARFVELQQQQQAQEAARQRAWQEAAARQAEAQAQYEAARRACYVALYDEKADPQYRADCAIAIENERRMTENARLQHAANVERQRAERDAYIESARQQEAQRERNAAAWRAVGDAFKAPKRTVCKPVAFPQGAVECTEQ